MENCLKNHMASTKLRKIVKLLRSGRGNELPLVECLAKQTPTSYEIKGFQKRILRILE